MAPPKTSKRKTKSKPRHSKMHQRYAALKAENLRLQEYIVTLKEQKFSVLNAAAALEKRLKKLEHIGPSSIKITIVKPKNFPNHPLLPTGDGGRSKC